MYLQEDTYLKKFLDIVHDNVIFGPLEALDVDGHNPRLNPVQRHLLVG